MRDGIELHGPDAEGRGRRDAALQTLIQVADDVVGVESARVRRELRALPPDLLPTALLPSRTA